MMHVGSKFSANFKAWASSSKDARQFPKAATDFWGSLRRLSDRSLLLKDVVPASPRAMGSTIYRTCLFYLGTT